MSVPWWAWVLVMGAVAVMLAVDLLLHRDNLLSLYFCLAGLLRRFVHLHYGLAVLLAFAGVKLILSETPVGKLPIPLTLGVIVGTIAVSIVGSLRSTTGGRV